MCRTMYMWNHYLSICWPLADEVTNRKLSFLLQNNILILLIWRNILYFQDGLLRGRLSILYILHLSLPRLRKAESRSRWTSVHTWTYTHFPRDVNSRGYFGPYNRLTFVHCDMFAVFLILLGWKTNQCFHLYRGILNLQFLACIRSSFNIIHRSAFIKAGGIHFRFSFLF